MPLFVVEAAPVLKLLVLKLPMGSTVELTVRDSALCMTTNSDVASQHPEYQSLRTHLRTGREGHAID